MMKRLRDLLLGTLMAACIMCGDAGLAMAQSAPTNEELAKRLDQLQMTLEALIKIQTQNANSSAAGGSAAPSPQAETATASPANSGYRKGLTLDLYLEPILGAEDMGKLLPIPKDMYPSASAVVAPRDGFSFAAFTEVDQMKRFAEPMEKRIGLNWTGYINVPETGANVFALELSVERQSGTKSCIASVAIDNHEVVRVLSADHDYRQRLSSDQGSISLAAGYHEFSLFGHCNGDRPYFGKVNFNVLTKGPNDRAPKALTADRFLTRR